MSLNPFGSVTMPLSKRLFDLIFSTLGMLILAIPFLFIALIIRMTSPGKAFYSQSRIGRDGKPFNILKFRTMELRAEDGMQLTIGDDPRITKVGSILRKTKVDELPQLINVMRGEMSLVGPRPEVKKYVDLYTPEQHEVLKITPGITDPASIRYRNESEVLNAQVNPEEYYIQVIMPEKIEENLRYFRRATFFSDIRVIFDTMIAIFK